MNFQPETVVYFLRTGIDDKNKVVIKTQNELFSILTDEKFFRGVMNDCSFQRADGYFIIRVDHSSIPYYSLLQCDTVLYKNDEQTGSFYIVGNILGVEWKNENCSFVSFKIDYFMTYQDKIAWEQTYALVEREHVAKDWSSSMNPLFSNMGPAEDFGTVADTPFYSWTKTFQPNQVLIMSPYDSSAEPVFNGTLRGNLYTSLQIDVMDPSSANSRFQAIAEKKEATTNNIVGVYGVPNDWNALIKSGGMQNASEDIPSVNIAGGQLPSMPEYNNAKCWSSPFINIRMMSSDGGSVDFTPQWLGNDQSNYTVSYRAGGSGGMFAGAQCTLRNKNGAFNWDVWNDFMVSISELPSCPWTGDGFRDWYARNGKLERQHHDQRIRSNTIQAIQGALGAVGSAASNPGVGSAIGLVSQFGNTLRAGDDQRTADLEYAAKIDNEKATGATVQGVSNFNNLVDVAAGKWGFKIVYYCTQIYTMKSVDAYFDRFGYRINQLKKLEVENRPIWTYVKTAECHVASSTGIPYVAEAAINAMFNRGVTMWKSDKFQSGRRIGDFSNPKENRGVA